MAEPTFPTGYSRPPNGGPQGMGSMKTWSQMMAMSTVNRLHPEVLRRFHALIHAAYTAGVPLGVGTGWRVQPNPPPAGFAQPGNSWHESTPVSPTSASALAIDTVPNVSWPWMYDHAGAYGLRTFKYVNNEPWHVQPAEIPASRKFATTPPPLTRWELPGTEPKPPEDEVTDADIKRIVTEVTAAITGLDIPGKTINFPTPVDGNYADFWSLLVDTRARVMALQADADVPSATQLSTSEAPS